MDFLPAEVQQYVETTTAPASDLLQKIERETHLHSTMPQMLSGHLQGRALAMFSQMIKPFRVLEIGTFTGYATLCLAEGLAENGKITTLDINEELETRVRGYFNESGHTDKIDYRVGNAMQMIPELKEEWDLVFIDADKPNYVNYFNLVIGQMKKGGFLIADNVLWSGKVVNGADDKKTRAIREFNELVNTDDRVENVLLPIRDGLMILRVK